MGNFKIGFIGLGLMGNPQAKNILKAGFSLSIYNRTKAKTKEFEKLGVKIFDSPKDLASNVDVLITMVTGPKDVEEVIFSKNGVVKGAKKGLVIIDMSTIGPSATQKIAKKLEKSGIDFLDAPVTGGTSRAESGELTIFVGGKEEIFKKVKDLLLTMGKDIHFIGTSGSGQTLKLVNNLVGATTFAVLSEVMLIADKLNIKRDKVFEALSTSHVISPVAKIKMQNLIKEEFSPTFTLSNMSKDISLAKKEAKGNKFKILNLVEKLYKKGKKVAGEEDVSAIIKVYN